MASRSFPTTCRRLPPGVRRPAYADRDLGRRPYDGGAAAAAPGRLHMVSAIAVAGRVGVTAIGDSPEQADQLYGRVRAALDEESRPA
jgi:hypothetical protein